MEKIDISNDIPTLIDNNLGYLERIKARKYLFIGIILGFICILSILGYYLFRYSTTDSELKVAKTENKQEQTRAIRDILSVLSNKDLDIISLRKEINKFEHTINASTSVLKLDSIYADYLDTLLIKTDDSEEKSRIYIVKGIAKIAVGNKLYYSNTRKYALALMSNYNQAIDYLDSSIKLKDGFLPHQYKGYILLDEGVNNEGAIKELKRAIEINPKDYLSYYFLGNAYTTIEKYDIAISYYLSGININANHDFSIVNLLSAYAENGDFQKKNDLFESYKSKCTDYCNLIYYNEYIDSTKFPQLKITDKKKIELLSKAIESSKLKGEIYRDAYRNRGRLYYYNYEILKGLNDLTLSLNDPNDPKTGNNVYNQNTAEEDSYYLIGQIYFERKEYGAAKNYLIKGKEIMPSESRFKKLIDTILDLEDEGRGMLKNNNTKDPNKTSEISVS